MTPTEINRRLALAIGYAPEDVIVNGTIVNVVSRGQGYVDCRTFDYRHASTIYPIAERYKMFPQWHSYKNKWEFVHGQSIKVVGRFLVEQDCPRACVALAVIEAKDRGLL